MKDEKESVDGLLEFTDNSWKKILKNIKYREFAHLLVQIDDVCLNHLMKFGDASKDLPKPNISRKDK